MNALVSIARILSTYLYPAILIAIFGICFLAKPGQKVTVPVADSETTLYFNAAKDPKWVTHLTDTHIAAHYPNAVRRVNESLRLMVNVIHPTFFIHSGDITDNYLTDSPPTPSHPIKDHWDLWVKMKQESGIKDEMLFEVFGNHDMWGMVEFDKKKSLAATHTKVDMNNFFSESRTRNGIRVISFAPYLFPTGHGGQNFAPKVTTEMLDALEKNLVAPTDADFTIVTCHFTHHLMYPMAKTSKTKLTYSQLLNKHKIPVFLGGHTHPKDFEMWHLGKVIEIIEVDTRMKEGMGLLSWDNGHLYYRRYNISNKKHAILTYPTPSKMETAIQKSNDVQIRVVAFSDDATNFVAKTNDGFECKLLFNRTIGQAKLYTCDANLKTGLHALKISGDLEDEVEFSIGEKYGPFSTNLFRDIVPYSFVVGISLSMAYQVVLNTFMFLPDSLSFMSPFIEAGKWLNGEDIEGTKWLVSLLSGPIINGHRLHSLSLWLRIAIVVFSAWFLCLPIVFYKTDGHLSMLWSWGYICNGIYRFDIFDLLFGSVYLLCTVVSMQSVLLLLNVLPNFSFIVDGILVIVLVVASEFIWYTYGFDIATNGYWASSFCFFIFPIIDIIFSIIAFVFKYKKKARVENEAELDNIDQKVEHQEEEEKKEKINNNDNDISTTKSVPEFYV